MTTNSNTKRLTSLFLLFVLLADIVHPQRAWALTGGPSQPEVQSFEPVATSEMVDLASGDFTYNIPLLDVDGYPVNISYHSGITMDQEASWVGLGWNINPGSINRNMRGLPDDFKGDEVRKQFNMKPNRTFGAVGGIGIGVEAAGFQALSIGAKKGINYNNYVGVGFETIMNISATAGNSGKSSLTAGLGIKSSTAEGLEISPSLSFSAGTDKREHKDIEGSGKLSAGASFNSRSGLKTITLSGSGSYSDKNHPKESGSKSGSTSLTFGTTTYVPQITMPMINSSVTLSGKIGATVFSIDATGDISGYYSQQKLDRTDDSQPAYGYLYSQKGQGLDKVLLDFNREKDGVFTANTPALPVTNFTYDVYSVSGQGIGGVYRPFRGDMGSVFDSRVENTSDSYSLGVEVKAANVAQVGLDVSVTDVYTTSGKWEEDNNAQPQLQFQQSASGDLYEPFYFKEAGEKSVDSDPGFFEKIGKEKAVRIPLKKLSKFDFLADNSLVDKYGHPVANTTYTNYKRAARQNRNQAITFLTKAEAAHVGLPTGASGYGSTSDAPDYHIGEITALKPDGKRYVYGIAAYNKSQKEVTFDCEGTSHTIDPRNGLVSYAAPDNSTGNTCGEDNYFSDTELPAYAHSYLLTAVLSPDYVDISNNGPSPSDLGSYTRFNYSSPTDYKWRVPAESGKANFNEGLRTLKNDNKASYIYGTKELWYLKSIETKNYAAVFHTTARLDGIGVAGEDGDNGSGTMQKLDSINLYSIADYDTSSHAPISGAVSIKTVHFLYDYSLCPGVPNFSGHTDPGKLTLLHIYFTYGTSNRARLSPYSFHYDNINPAYNIKGYDRWGNYKRNPSHYSTYTEIPGGALDTAILNTTEYPYVVQDTASARQNTSAWSISSINLPSGGIIKINYESDDYGYVQDKRAMQMFKITRIGNGPGDNPDPDAGVPTNNSHLKDSTYLFFKLQKPIVTHNLDTLKKRYFDGITDLYFRAFVKTNSIGYEYISGYATPEDVGFCTSNYAYGWVKLKLVHLGGMSSELGTDVNPITKAALQMARLNTPREAFGYDEPNSTLSVTATVEALVDGSLWNTVLQTMLGPNQYLMTKGYGKDIMLNKSWIRLNSPYQSKLGGGSRVKSLEISDEWNGMATAQEVSSYGQTYDYTIPDPLDPTLRISSGVATNEPIIGGDENPFRKPVYFGNKDQVLLAPDDKMYSEEPFGESFFPGPSVVYGKVTVTNFAHDQVKKHAAGTAVHEFYTSKDYPIIVDRTDLDPHEGKTSPLGKLLKWDVKHCMTMSQGFEVILNDMPGKPKAQWIYGEDQSVPISGVEYFYKDNGTTNSFGTRVRGNRLDNNFTVIDQAGAKSTALVGEDYDFISDFRESKTVTQNSGDQINFYYFQVAIVPVFLPPVWPSYSKEKTRFRSASVTKVINQYGLLEETVAYDLGSKVSTKNLALDSETGEVLLTKTRNEFNDEIYSFTYPAHWAYDGMGQAFKNWGYTDSYSNLSTSHFFPGDEVFVLPDSTKAWAKGTPGSLTLIDNTGAGVTPSGDIKVIRSGRRNQQSLSVGTITSMKNPLDETSLDHLGYSINVLQAGANIFSEDWKTYCECPPFYNKDATPSSNPYMAGVKGNWRMKKAYLYLTDRDTLAIDHPTDLRHNGTFRSFHSFWNPPGSEWSIDSTGWQWTSQVTDYSPYGHELENQDALLRYSAALYGYDHTLPTAVASNSRYRDIAFDNFEDYDFGNCVRDHFSYKEFSGHISTTTAHTGKRSIKVTHSDGNNVIVTKVLDPCN